ncbi:hypothetical protein BVC80_1837g125 [Macleaya cordata]|uniref:Uncharacterized protein n=1 Tax=Macleaya cordata TaxID=56857 RepID=A0A200R3Q8_MACCD|nr:hypothetical protein BVC80_1837g125 [Macleaya cordata]
MGSELIDFKLTTIRASDFLNLDREIAQRKDGSMNIMTMSETKSLGRESMWGVEHVQPWRGAGKSPFKLRKIQNDKLKAEAKACGVGEKISLAAQRGSHP